MNTFFADEWKHNSRKKQKEECMTELTAGEVVHIYCCKIVEGQK